MTVQAILFHSLRFSLFSLVHFIYHCSATCYGLDGNTMTPEFQPCSSVAGAITVCCATNRTNYFGGSSFQGPTADRCLPNGLCHNVEVYSPSTTYVQYWRNGCTVTPVDVEHCLDICTKPEQVIGGGFALMTPCDGTPNSTTWCCGKNDTCCGTDSEVTLPATLGASLSLSSTIAAPTDTLSSSFNSHQTSSAAVASSGDDHRTSLTSGALAGVIVSSTVAVLAVLALLILGRRWRRRKAAAEGAPKDTAGLNTPMIFNTPPLETTHMPFDRPLSKTPHTLQDTIATPLTSIPLSPIEKDGPDERAFELS